MPIGFFGAGSPFASSGTTTAVNLSPPASVPSGAFLLAAIALNSQTAILTPPSGEGWASVFPDDGAGVEQYGPASGLSQRLYWKISDGSEPSPHAFTLSGTGQQVSGGIIAYTGVDTSTPFDVTWQGLLGDNDLFIEFPAITPTTSGAYILRFGSANLGSTTPTAITGPTGFTSRMTALHRRPTYVAEKAWSSGTEAAADATMTSAVTGLSQGISLVLRPGTGGSDTTPPSTVTGLGRTFTSSQVTLTWNSATDNVAVTGYNVYRATSSGGTYTKLNASPVGALTYIDSPNPAGTYYYVVRAVDTSNNESTGNSNEVSATTTVVAGNATCRWRRVGAPTDDGFIAAANFPNATSVRLVVSTSPSLSSPTYFPASPQAVDTQKYAKVEATGLTANTQYYYGWETDGYMAPFPSGETNHGRCKTFPTAGVATTFRVAAASCQTSSSDSSVFNQVVTDEPLIILHMGDKHYDDINSSDQNLYRTAFETQINRVNQQAMEATTPDIYVFNDHDFCGNNSARDWVGNGSVANVGRTAVQAVYRQIIPHYPLNATTGAIWASFAIGRVQFFLMDTRSESTHKGETDNSSKTKLGAEQKAAFKAWLLANPTAPKIVMTGEAFHNNESDTSDGWNNYSTERTELVNYIAANGITNGVWLAGDQHAVCYADEANGTPAGWPCIGASPLDQDPSHKGGPWAKRYPDPITDPTTKIQQYALLEFVDDGSSTVTMTIKFKDGAGTALLTPDTVVTFSEAETETLRPMATRNVSAAFTPNTDPAAYQALDEDPEDATLLDPLTLVNPSGSTSTHPEQSADALAAVTGFNATSWTSQANALDTSDATAATFATAAAGNYGSYFSFNAADFTGIPSNAIITGIQARVRMGTSNANRINVWLQLGTANGSLIGSEGQTDGGTALPTTVQDYGANLSPAFGVIPTRAQLITGTFGIRLRFARSASQNATLSLYRVALTVTYRIPGSTVNTKAEVLMADPVANLATGADTGEIRVAVNRKGTPDGGAGNPTFRAEIHENGSATVLATPIAETAVTIPNAATVLAGTFNQDVITNKNNVEVWLIGTGVAGGAVEFDAVEWNAQVTAGAQNITKTVTDALGVTDARSLARALPRSVTDALGITDSSSMLKSKAFVVTDALGITDSANRTRGLGRTVTDSVGITDSNTVVRAITRSISDTLGVTDSRTTVKTIARAVNDAIGIIDAANRAVGYSRSVTDTLGLSDGASMTKGKAFSVTDAIGMTDSLAVARTYVKNVTDSLGITDARVINKALGRAVVDSLGITDSNTRLKTISRSVNDTLGISDPMLRSIGRTRILTDNMGMVDVATSALTLVIAKNVTDTLGITDNRTLVKSVQRSITDALGITDSRTIIRTVSRSLTDSIGVTDNRVVTKAVTRIVTDTLGMTDSRVKSQTYIKSLTDSLGITDSATRQMLLVVARTITDSIGVTDSRTLIKNVVKNVNDTLGIVDSRTVAKAIARGINDAIGISDTFSKTMTRNRVIADTLGVTDVTLPLKSSFIQRTINDVLGITDVTQKSSASIIARTITDNLGMVDSRARGLHIVRTDTLGMSDVALRTAQMAKTLTDNLGLFDTQDYTKNMVKTINDVITVTDGAGRALVKLVDVTDVIGLADGVEWRIIGFTVSPFMTAELIAIPTSQFALLGVPSATGVLEP